MLARERARSACGGSRPSPTARLQCKSTVCGLNGFLPSAKADGSLHLNPQPRSSSTAFRALAPPPLWAAADLTGGRINVGVHELLSLDEDLGPQPNRPNEVLK
jgi:hypothetical protein